MWESEVQKGFEMCFITKSSLTATSLKTSCFRSNFLQHHIQLSSFSRHWLSRLDLIDLDRRYRVRRRYWGTHVYNTCSKFIWLALHRERNMLSVENYERQVLQALTSRRAWSAASGQGSDSLPLISHLFEDDVTAVRVISSHFDIFRVVAFRFSYLFNQGFRTTRLFAHYMAGCLLIPKYSQFCLQI